MTLSSAREDIKQRSVLSEWVGRWVQLQRRGQEYLGLCPFHQEKTPSFSVNNAKGFYHCFGCGVHGDIFSFLMHIQKWTFMETMEHLAQSLNITLPRASLETEAQRSEKHTSIALLQAAHAWFQMQLESPSGQKARAYLEQRAFPAEMWQAFELGYAPSSRTGLKNILAQQGFSVSAMMQAGVVIEQEACAPYDRFRERIIFPIKNAKNQVIAFGGRALGEGQPKYLNSPETPLFHKGHTLYNLQNAHAASVQDVPLLVVEGYLDVIRLHQQGWPGMVAPLGTAVTEAHIHALWRYDSEPIFVLDGDAAGRKASERLALKALTLLQPGYSIKVARLPEGEDPDSLLAKGERDRFQKCLDQAQPLVHFLWSQLFETQDHSTPERWALARKNLMDAVGSIPDVTVRHLYRQAYETRWRALERPRSLGGAVSKRTPSFAVASQVSGCSQPPTTDVKAALLLEMCVIHPSLIADVSESLAALVFEEPDLKGIRDALIHHLCENPEMDALMLWKALCASGWESALHNLKKKTQLHGGFALRLQTPEDLLGSWYEIWHVLQQPRQGFFKKRETIRSDSPNMRALG